MSISKIASRYAKPLLELAIEQNKLDTVVSDIKSFQNALENRDLYMLLKSPIVKPTKKMSILQALFQGKMGETAFSFIEIIVRKGRENLLPEIAAEFITQYKAYKKITTVSLTTAQKLSDAEISAIKAKLISSQATEASVDIVEVIDPSIIGGFILNIEDKLYDASVQHKLDELKKSFRSNEYVKAI